MAEAPRHPHDLPLFRWGAELRRTRPRRRRLHRRITLMTAGLGLFTVTIVAPPTPRLVWNASASLPIGLYGVTPGAQVRAGDIVLAWAPKPARELAHHRRYLPRTVPLLKRVGAVSGDTVCALGQEMFIDGRWVAERRVHDRHGRLMPWWRGCHRLHDGELFLLVEGRSDSFDGRYFGVSPASDIIGKAVLLWRR